MLFPLIRSFSVFLAGFAELKSAVGRVLRGFSRGLPVVPYVHQRTARLGHGTSGTLSRLLSFSGRGLTS